MLSTLDETVFDTTACRSRLSYFESSPETTTLPRWARDPPARGRLSDGFSPAVLLYRPSEDACFSYFCEMCVAERAHLVSAAWTLSARRDP
mmetsp:Transcript_45132/g.119776  ORF Transcript_45132/g.119776 Transcript_45132/m.119776 type:complete len:91 (+) Transcript_45132:1810-2082(+)